MMTGRCLKPLAGVYNYAEHCRRGWLGRLMAHQPSPSSAYGVALFTRKTSALNHQEPSWEPWEQTLQSRIPLGCCKTVQLIYHTPKYANTQMRACDSSLQQALIKLCSWAPLLCDWCLASLALTNTDWSQTCNDFGPNLFKDRSLYVWKKTKQKQKKGKQERFTSQAPLQPEQGRAGRYLLSQLVSHLCKEKRNQG